MTVTEAVRSSLRHSALRLPSGKDLTCSILLSAGLFLGALAWFSFWLFRQPFFDDDYSRWLLPSFDVTFRRLLLGIFTPVSADWGFLDRPVVALFFKTMHALRGIDPAPYFGFKACVGALLAALIGLFCFRAARSYGHPRGASVTAAVLSSALFVTSEPVFMGMLWLCDMDVLAQCLLLASVLLYFACVHQARSRRRILFALLGLLLVAVSLCAFRTKASARVLPLLLLVHAGLIERDQWRWLLPLLLLLCVPLIPWAVLQEAPLPEFLPGSGKQAPGFFWSRPNAVSFSALAIGDMTECLPFREHSDLPHGVLQVLFPSGVGVLLLLAVHGIRNRRARTAAAPVSYRRYRAIAALWLLLAIPILAIYPRVDEMLLSRYLVGILVPLVLVVGLLLAHALAGLPPRLRAIVLLLVLAQILSNVFYTRLRKTREGAAFIVVDNLRQTVERSCTNACVTHMFASVYPYWPSTNRNTHISIQGSVDTALEKLAGLATETTNLYVITSTRIREPALQLVAQFDPPSDWYGRVTGMAGGGRTKYLFRKRPDTPFSWTLAKPDS